MRTASNLRRLATERLLDPSPEAVRRLEQALLNAMKAGAWVEAKRFLGFRRDLSERIGDSKEELATLAKIAEGLDYAIAERLPAGADGNAPTGSDPTP